MEMMREVRLQWLRPDEVVAERERVPIVYLPIGPLEWHGPHLPLGTDPLQAEHIALDLAQNASAASCIRRCTLARSANARRNYCATSASTATSGSSAWTFRRTRVPSFYYAEDAFALHRSLDARATGGTGLSA